MYLSSQSLCTFLSRGLFQDIDSEGFGGEGDGEGAGGGEGKGGFDRADARGIVEGVVGIGVIRREGDGASFRQLASFLHAVEAECQLAG